MKWILYFLCTFMMAPAFAQETPPPEDANYLSTLFPENAPSRTEWFWGVSYLRWTEVLRLQKSTLLDTDTATFVGLNLNLERQVVYANWGWGVGANFGSGRANAGGNSTLIAYSRNNEAWTSFGILAKAFQRLSPRVSLGVAVPLMLRNISWLSPDGVTEANSGQNINLGLLLDMVLRIDKKMDFYQQIGTLNSQGTAFWRLGLNIRI
jgi:hypothetical protein